jgi:hypothetical protein
VAKPVLDDFQAVFNQLAQLDPAELDSDLEMPEHAPLAAAEFVFANFAFTAELRDDLILVGLTELALRAQRGEPLGCDADCDCGWRPLHQTA